MSGRITYDHWPHGEKPPQIIKTGEPTPFATFVRRRNPCFKAHTTLGHAKSAITQDLYRGVFRGESALYEWDGINSQWILRVHVQRDTTKQDYLLWSDPAAFKQGLTNVIDEEPALEDA